MTRTTTNRLTALILILEGLLIFAPMIILGGAIGWPDILGEPADVVLRIIFQEADATRIGYFAYLIYSILFFPAIVLVVRAAMSSNTSSSASRMAIGFAAASALARCIGIIRWLAAMPALAVAYNAPDASAESQQMIRITYETLNNYGGSIGEILGVSIFASLAVLMVAVVIFQNKGLPQWTGIFALISSIALMVPVLEILGVDPNALPGFILTLTVAVVQFWFLFVGLYLLFFGQREQATIAA